MARGVDVIWKPHPGSQELYLTCPADEALISGNRGGGKAQPLSSIVQTPWGPRPMGKINVGSKVLNPDGTASTVIGVFPQGKQKIYRILLVDGKYTYATIEHLWEIYQYRYPITIKSTADIIQLLANNVHVYIPIIKSHTGIVKDFADPWNYGVQIESIKEYGVEECQCIKINNPNGLYLTDDFIVTHNTDVLLMDYLQHVGQGHGSEWRGILFREEYTQLTDIINKSRKWVSQIFPGAKYNGSEHKWTFPEGELLYLRYMRVPSDYWNYHGHEYPWIGWEELTNWATDECYKIMMSCNRSSNPDVPRKCRATCNPSGPGHCVPYGDVLTPTGWKDIKNMQIGDAIFTVSKKGFIKETTISQTHKSYYSGEMIKTTQRGLTIECTPNHSIPKLGGVVGNRESYFTLLPFEELPGEASILRSGISRGTNSEFFKVPVLKTRKRKLQQPTQLHYEDYAELMGWFLSEGCTIDRDKAFKISQIKKEQRREIEHLLNRCGFLYSYNGNGYLIHAPDWWGYLKQFGKCPDKFIPLELKKASIPVLKKLFVALVRGDGTMYPSGEAGEYYTISQQLSDDVCEVALKLGYVIGTRGTTIRFKRTSNKCSTIHTGNHRYSVDTVKKRCDTTRYQYDGNVYCIGIENTHTFIIRQEGSVWISGNSWVKQRFIDAMPPLSVHIDPETEKSRVNIPSSLSENTTLLEADPNYEKTILAAAKDDPVKYKAWVLGEWDIMAGGALTDVWAPEKQQLPPFEIPKSWTVVRSFDWGSTKPWAVTYGVECNGEQPDVEYELPYFPPGTVILIDEIYGWTGKVNEGDQAVSQEIAERILAKDAALGVEYGCKVYSGPADTSIYEVRDGTSIGQTLASYGCHWKRAYKGSGSRVAGLALIRQMLSASKRGDLERPGLYFFNRAIHHIRTFPLLQYDEKKTEDVNTEQEDHCYDSTRYLLTRKFTKMKRRKVRH